MNLIVNYTKTVYTIIEVINVLKNITLSADEDLIEKARKKAADNNTTLNEMFRHWLTVYAKGRIFAGELEAFIQKTGYANSGGSFSRDELNER